MRRVNYIFTSLILTGFYCRAGNAQTTCAAFPKSLMLGSTRDPCRMRKHTFRLLKKESRILVKLIILLIILPRRWIRRAAGFIISLPLQRFLEGKRLLGRLFRLDMCLIKKEKKCLNLLAILWTRWRLLKHMVRIQFDGISTP